MRTLLKFGIIGAGVALGVQAARKYNLVEKGLVAAQELGARGQVLADLVVVKAVSVADGLLTKANELLSPEPTGNSVGDENTTPQNFSGGYPAGGSGERTGTGWPGRSDA